MQREHCELCGTDIDNGKGHTDANVIGFDLGIVCNVCYRELLKRFQARRHQSPKAEDKPS